MKAIETPIPVAPITVALVVRPRHGCRQYPFFNWPDLAAWLERKPYCSEFVRVIRVVDGHVGGSVFGQAMDLRTLIQQAGML